MSVQARDGKWRVRWREDGRHLSATFDNQDDAEAFDLEMRRRSQIHKADRHLERVERQAERRAAAATQLAQPPPTEVAPAADPEPTRFVALRVVAERAGVSIKTVRRAVNAGELPAFYIGSCVRVADTDVQAWIQGRVREPTFPKPRSTSWSGEEREYAQILAHDPCSYCGAPMEHVDHIDPLSRGGEHVWSNLTAACRSCNVSKLAKPLLEFLRLNAARDWEAAA